MRRSAGTLVLVALVAVGFWIVNPAFLSVGNVVVMLRSSAFIGLVAVGMGFLLIGGMIDISVGAVAGLASIVFAHCLVTLKTPLWAAVGAGVATGALCGLVNAVLILKLKLPAFLATIGTMYVFRGIAQTLSKGYTIYPLPPEVAAFGDASPLGVSWAWWLFAAALIVGELVLAGTVWGLKVKAIGSDREIARMTEVDVNRVSTQLFVLCSVCAAVAGILLTARVASGTPTLGEGWELSAITAAAIGGVSLFGFEGSMFAVLLGVGFIQIVQNGLVVVGASSYLQSVEVGSLLLLTAIVDVRRKAKLEQKEVSR